MHRFLLLSLTSSYCARKVTCDKPNRVSTPFTLKKKSTCNVLSEGKYDKSTETRYMSKVYNVQTTQHADSIGFSM